MTEMKGCSAVSPILPLPCPSFITNAAGRPSERQLRSLVYVCVIKLFASLSKSVYAQLCVLHLSTSQSLSALMCTVCVMYVLRVSVCCASIHAMCLLLVAHMVLLCCGVQPAL